MAKLLENDWTEAKCLELIREYKRRPLLWDKKNRYFHNINMKPTAWEEIGDAINISAYQCKHKMRRMIKYFRKQQAEIVKNTKDLTSDRRIVTSRPYRSTWFAFGEMAFLLHPDSESQQNEDSDEIDENKGDTKRPSTLTLRTLERKSLDQSSGPAEIAMIMSGNNETEVRESDILQPQAEAGPSQMPSEDENRGDTKRPSTLNLLFLRQRFEQSSRPAKKARVMSSNNETEVREPDIIQPQTEAGPSQMPSERDKEIVSFTTFIANKMKTYSDTTKNAVQQAICDIIIKADQNHYESNCYEKFTITEEADPLKKETFEEYIEHKPIIKIEYSDSDY